MKQLIFAVESDSRAKTDDRYIYKLVLYRYNLSDKDTKIQFVHMCTVPNILDQLLA